MKNRIVRRLALLLSVVMLITSTVNTSFAFIVTQTDSIVNIFTPFDSDTNDLQISKSVEHPLGDTYVIPDTITFPFMVELGTLYANTNVETSGGNVLADGNGTIFVSVKPGTPLLIKGIDANTEVTVAECTDQLGAGFGVKEGTAATQTVTVTAAGAKVDFVNVYVPEKATATDLTVVGEKILTGRDWQEGDSFSFELEQKEEDNSWTSLGTKTITYDAANEDFNKFDFSDIMQALTFDKVGTYTFRMTEIVDTPDGNMDYDRSEKLFYVSVTDTDMDGQLEIGDVTAAAGNNITVTKSGEKYIVEATFDNSFVAPITVPVKVSKTVNNTGTATMGPENFEFVLAEVGSAADPMKKRTDVNGEAVFALTFTKADIGVTYTYELSETDEGAEGVTYSRDTYEISVAITKDGASNKLQATITMGGNEVTDAVAAFTNTYHADLPDPEDIKVEIGVEKTVKNTGAVAIGPGGFEFVLEDMVSHNKILTDTDEDGEATFSLTFTKDDIGKTYTYGLYEKDEGVPGVIYDTRVYEVTVEITLGADNKLSAAVKLDGVTVTKAVAAFENEYNMASAPGDITVLITVNKTVKNIGVGKISPKGFEFVLENTESGSKLTAKTDKDGKAVFELPFTAGDIGKTYTYELSEVKGNVLGVTYDRDKYTITVTIAEDAVNHTLVAALTMNGEAVDEVVAAFENTYRVVSSGGGDGSKPGAEGTDESVESGKTGDQSRMNFWFVMMIVSGIASVTLLILDRRYARKKD